MVQKVKNWKNFEIALEFCESDVYIRKSSKVTELNALLKGDG